MRGSETEHETTGGGIHDAPEREHGSTRERNRATKGSARHRRGERSMACVEKCSPAMTEGSAAT